MPAPRPRQFAALVAGLLCAASAAGCSLVGSDPADLDLLGGSVDGLQLGDPEAAVTAQWGEPTRLTESPTLATYEYGQGAGERLFAVVRRDEGGDGGLATTLVVTIGVRPGYQGQTESGVGIGSSRDAVEAELGTTADCTIIGTYTCFYSRPDHTVHVAYPASDGDSRVGSVLMRKRGT